MDTKKFRKVTKLLGLVLISLITVNYFTIVVSASEIIVQPLEESFKPSKTLESNIDNGIDDYTVVPSIAENESTNSNESVDVAKVAESLLEKLDNFDISKSMDMSEKIDLTEDEIFFILQYSLRDNGSENMIKDLTYNELLAEIINSSEKEVNEFFIISVIYWETARFSSKLLKNNNNFGGCKANSGNWMKFDTAEEGISYEIEVIERNMSNGTDIHSVNETYCPNDDYFWATNVLSIMKQFKNASIDAAKAVLEQR